jgi:phage portal protein BeeE
MEAVWPLLTQFRDDLNRTVGRDLKSEMEFDKDSFDAIAAARTEAADRVHKLWTAGLITQNEGRRDLEYDTVAGGDVFYAPANFLPLGGEVAPEAEGS